MLHIPHFSSPATLVAQRFAQNAALHLPRHARGGTDASSGATLWKYVLQPVHQVLTTATEIFKLLAIDAETIIARLP